jgi:hypothetical protein
LKGNENFSRCLQANLSSTEMLPSQKHFLVDQVKFIDISTRSTYACFFSRQPPKHHTNTILLFILTEKNFQHVCGKRRKSQKKEKKIFVLAQFEKAGTKQQHENHVDLLWRKREQRAKCCCVWEVSENTANTIMHSRPDFHHFHSCFPVLVWRENA